MFPHLIMAPQSSTTLVSDGDPLHDFQAQVSVVIAIAVCTCTAHVRVMGVLRALLQLLRRCSCLIPMHMPHFTTSQREHWHLIEAQIEAQV
jgi:hypothetical protein